MKNRIFFSSTTWQGLLALSVCLTFLAEVGLGAGVMAQSNSGPKTPSSPASGANQESLDKTSSPSQTGLSVPENVRLGDDRYAQADYKGAVEAYSRALQAYKLNAYALYNRANAYRQLEEYESAIADYSTSLKIAPDNLFAYLYRGIALFDNQQPEPAIADFTKVIEQDPNHALAFQKRGESHLAKRDATAAIQDLEAAAKLYEKAEKFRKQSQILQQIKKVKSAQSKN